MAVRVTQQAVEAVATPSTVKARVTQYAVQALVTSRDAVYATQGAVEAIVVEPRACVSQFAVEAIAFDTGSGPRVTQLAVEAVATPSTVQARVTQLAVQAVVCGVNWHCDGSSDCEIIPATRELNCDGTSTCEWDWYTEDPLFEWNGIGTCEWDRESAFSTTWRMDGRGMCDWQRTGAPTKWRADGVGELIWMFGYGVDEHCIEGDGDTGDSLPPHNYVF